MKTSNYFFMLAFLWIFSSCQKPNPDEDLNVIAGWEGLTFIQDAEDLNDIAVLDDQTYIAVGESGKIFKTVDGGENWKLIPSNTDKNLLKVHFWDSQNGYINIEEKSLWNYSIQTTFVLKTADGGDTWQSHDYMYLSEEVDSDLFPYNAQTIRRVYIQFMTQDYGLLVMDMSYYFYKDCDPNCPPFRGEGFGIFFTIDGGLSWQKTDHPYFKHAVDMRSFGSDLALLVYNDHQNQRGSFWNAIHQEFTEITSFSSIQEYPNIRIAYNSQESDNSLLPLISFIWEFDGEEWQKQTPRLLLSRDGGINWEIQDLPVAGDIYFANEEEVYLLSEPFMISNNGGASWEPVNGVEGLRINAMASPGAYFVGVGSQGCVYKWKRDG